MIRPNRLAVTLMAFGLSLTAARPVAATEPDSIVSSVSVAELRFVMAEAALTDIAERTADPQFPSIGSRQSDGFTIQGTLFACQSAGSDCRGADIIAIIPATTRRNAEIIEGSIERSVFGFDASIIELRERGGGPSGRFAVMISAYLVFDGGVSETLLPETLRLLLEVVSQTKGFMLSEDPAHALLWAGQTLPR